MHLISIQRIIQRGARRFRGFFVCICSCHPKKCNRKLKRIRKGGELDEEREEESKKQKEATSFHVFSVNKPTSYTRDRGILSSIPVFASCLKTRYEGYGDSPY